MDNNKLLEMIEQAVAREDSQAWLEDVLYEKECADWAAYLENLEEEQN